MPLPSVDVAIPPLRVSKLWMWRMTHILALTLLAFGFHFFGFGDCFVDVAD